MSSKAMAGEGPRIPHLAPPTKEIGDLRGDVDDSFERLEARTDYPVIKKVVAGMAVDLSNVGAAPEAHAIHGTGFLQDGVQATLTLGTGTSQLDFTANRPGTGGNALEVELATGGAESVSVAAGIVTVTMNTGTSTPDSIKTTCEADADFVALMTLVSGGAGVAVVVAQTPLAGGLGEDLVVKLAGIEQRVGGKVTDILIPLTVDDVTDLTALDSAAVEIICNSVKSEPVAVGIIA